MFDIEIIENNKTIKDKIDYLGADIIITKKMLIALIEGKCLAYNPENYTNFIVMEKGWDKI